MEASALSHPVGLGRFRGGGPLLRLRSDDQLVALFRGGHDEAFGAIHDRYRQRLHAYARQMLGGSRSDAEDVLQDVFLRAYHALRADGRPITLRAWLYRVAHNRCIDHLRRPAPVAQDVFDLNRVPADDPLTAAERREDLRRLVADVRRLPEHQRSALLMREMEGLSYNELADALGVTVPAIKSLLVRARIGLVEAIEARDTACAEIRVDLAAAQDRGVRASGRSRRHLRECSGCRDYRTRLRGVEKQLNGLSPGCGPLATFAKVLGLSGSGAAAGGTVVATGGGGAAAGAGGVAVGSAVTAATATKVVAVVAAAAVAVGGGAKVERSVEHHRAPATAAQRATPVAASPAAAAVVRGPTSTVTAPHDPTLRLASVTAPAVDDRAGGARSHSTIADVDPTDVEVGPQAPASGAAPIEPTTGGAQAPDDADDAAALPAVVPGTTGPATTDTTTGSAPATTGVPTASAATPPATNTATTPPSPSAQGTGATVAPSSTSPAPAGQGATAPPAG